MSGVEQEVRRRVRRFSEEFKRDAVRVVVEEGYTIKAAATAVGVSDQHYQYVHDQAGGAIMASMLVLTPQPSAKFRHTHFGGWSLQPLLLQRAVATSLVLR